MIVAVIPVVGRVGRGKMEIRTRRSLGVSTMVAGKGQTARKAGEALTRRINTHGAQGSEGL